MDWAGVDCVAVGSVDDCVAVGAGEVLVFTFPAWGGGVVGSAEHAMSRATPMQTRAKVGLTVSCPVSRGSVLPGVGITLGAVQTAGIVAWASLTRQ